MSSESTSEKTMVLAGYRYALSLTHHSQDAEDLVQQACLRVFRAKRRLDNKAYLLRSIRNLFYDSCRKRNVVSVGELGKIPLEDPSPGHWRTVDGKLDVATILSSLHHEEREVLYLNCVENFTAEEIGRITGKPRGTILSQLSRSKEKIRRNHDVSPISEKAV